MPILAQTAESETPPPATRRPVRPLAPAALPAPAPRSRPRRASARPDRERRAGWAGSRRVEASRAGPSRGAGRVPREPGRPPRQSPGWARPGHTHSGGRRRLRVRLVRRRRCGRKRRWHHRGRWRRGRRRRWRRLGLHRCRRLHGGPRPGAALRPSRWQWRSRRRRRRLRRGLRGRSGSGRRCGRGRGSGSLGAGAPGAGTAGAGAGEPGSSGSAAIGSGRGARPAADGRRRRLRRRKLTVARNGSARHRRGGEPGPMAMTDSSGALGRRNRDDAPGRRHAEHDERDRDRADGAGADS